MEKITNANFQTQLPAAGFEGSKCGVCGLPKWKFWKKGVNNKVIEVRPTQTQFGSYVIFENNQPVSSGYLYELSNVIEKYFPAA